ncbi:hypothetical protein MtrunA17_Chr3g0088641 [Medicago truncatula]|uniref:F-box SKIP23-like protein n=1 Tax=Medicago truncatula TaxID=3880 RepID=G7IZH9_MEDTR|nr:F-box protein SKIP23 [Medicago truncatula]AES69423.1 F-box SKIP23-like protein [Medicago truncatula]RHN66232.1 hypothetical protein MtrunA17_Chr3g0088641 [Medicago truncatula]
MAADWSQLPRELLQLISQKLNRELYLIRSRSVCSWWRSSIPNYYQKHYLPVKFGQLSCQLFGSHTNVDAISYLIKHDIFLIKPPKHKQTLHQCPWLIRIGPNFDGKTQLLYPFLFNSYKPLPSCFNNVLDFNKLSVIHLRQMSYIYCRCCLKSYVATCQGEQPLVFLTTDLHGNPIMFRCGDDRSKTIPNMSANMSTFRGRYVCYFRGRPCMVDKTGRTVMIESDLSYHFIAEPVIGGESKFLVETSDFQLLLVDIYKNDDRVIVRIDVFRLDEKQKKWVKLTNLGDLVLFLESDYSFSACASDLGLGSGNCVIYNNGITLDFNMSVFHLDQGRISPLSDYPDHLKMFGPPPEWIAELHS